MKVEKLLLWIRYIMSKWKKYSFSFRVYEFKITKKRKFKAPLSFTLVRVNFGAPCGQSSAPGSFAAFVL